MITYIYQKSLWKYKTTKEEYNKYMINNIIFKNRKSLIFSLYQSNIIERNYSETYIYKLYNLYQSIKNIIKLTESGKIKEMIIHPLLLNKCFNKYYSQNLEKQNKIIVKRKSKNKKRDNNDNNNDNIQFENSISSIKKTIDLDEKDNIQKGCFDFASGNEMLILLNNFQKKKKNECLYNNYYNNCNIYKKKKSPQASFHLVSPKNKYIFGEIEYNENINNKNKMINNNIFINNNNYNNHTNYIINDYNDIKEIDNYNNYNYDYKERALKMEKKYYHFSNFKSQTKTNLFSNRLTYRNRFSLPLSQSCEKFIYTKKNICSKLNQVKLGNKTSEEKENELNRVNNNNEIKVKYIPFIDKTSNIKIIENNDKEDNIKIVKIEKLNYIGRNNNNINYNTKKNKSPFSLSKIAKNSKNSRRTNVAQEPYLTKFNSTFNKNYYTNFKTKQKLIDKLKKEKTLSNNFIIKNNINKINDKIKNNPLISTIHKKDKKCIKRKENNLKFKKNNTAKSNF